MAASNLLDEKSHSIVRSTAFVNHVDWFLRKEQRFGDTAVRVASNELLKSYANKYCRKYLDTFFPDIRVTGIPDAHHVYRKVARQYKTLKADLLRRARLSYSPELDHSSATVLSISSMAEKRSSSNTSQSGSHKSRLKRRGRRKRHKFAKYDGDASCIGNQVVEVDCVQGDMPENSTCIDKAEQPENYDTGQQNLPTLSNQVSMHTCRNFRLSIPERPRVIDREAPSPVSEQTESLIQRNKQLAVENERLRAENQTLIDHRTFVETTLRICQDTYLEEAQSAMRVGIYTQASQCNVIVDVIRDLRSDLDVKYFSDYYLLNGHAPPSRYWLDGVRKRKQQYDVLWS